MIWINRSNIKTTLGMAVSFVCHLNVFVVFIYSTFKKQYEIFKSLTWEEADSTENIETFDELKADNEQMVYNYHLSIKPIRSFSPPSYIFKSFERSQFYSEVLYAKEIKNSLLLFVALKIVRIISCKMFHLYQWRDLVQIHSLQCDLNSM